MCTRCVLPHSGWAWDVDGRRSVEVWDAGEMDVKLVTSKFYLMSIDCPASSLIPGMQ